MTGAWDSHAHVIGDPARYPFARGRAYTPAPASLEAYLAFLDAHGLACGVLVQPSAYGFDHACLLDALDEAGGRLRGVAVPAPDATPADLERLHRRGVRGVRCNLINPGGLEPEIIARWAPALCDLGWHVEAHIEIDRVGDLARFVDRFEATVVIDHMGRPRPESLDPDVMPARALVGLVRDGRCLVKLSAPYRSSAQPAPWSDVVPLARALVAARPDGCLWGSDWPHVHTDAVVAAGDLMRALDAWCPDPALRSAITSGASRRLFGAD